MDPSNTVHHGWLPDAPDPTDHTPAHPAVAARIRMPARPDALPHRRNVAAEFPPVRHQGSLPSCTAFATSALLEHASREGVAFAGQYAAALFVYKVALNAVFGDPAKVTPPNTTMGLSARTTFQAFVQDGAPPERTWPYPPEGTAAEAMQAAAAQEPPPEIYRRAARVEGLQYVRLDPQDTSPADAHHHIRSFIDADEPCLIGFDYYRSVYDQMVRNTKAAADGESPLAANRGAFAYPSAGDTTMGGGHCVVVVGYDDAREIPNDDAGTEPAVGAYRIRNSWGPRFQGADCEPGHGWLPYAYVDPARAPAGSTDRSSPLARDAWALLATNWR